MIRYNKLSPIKLQAAKVGLDPDISAIIVGSVNLGFTVVSSLLVDRLGRRVLLLTSIVGMTICTAALGLFFFLFENDFGVDMSNLAWLPLTSLCLYLVSFALGYGKKEQSKLLISNFFHFNLY